MIAVSDFHEISAMIQNLENDVAKTPAEKMRYRVYRRLGSANGYKGAVEEILNVRIEKTEKEEE